MTHLFEIQSSPLDKNLPNGWYVYVAPGNVLGPFKAKATAEHILAGAPVVTEEKK